MIQEVYYVHGSRSSVDFDVFVVVPHRERTKKECQELCEYYEEQLGVVYPHKKVNANLISINAGKVIWCYKGTVDEVNNGLLLTYPLHKQTYPLTVTDRIPRNVDVKAIRAIRVILSFLSRTPHREMVKDALRGDIFHKLKVLSLIDLSQITDLGDKNVEFKDYLKTVAFQMGQVIGLFMNKEFFTKEEIAEHLPHLKPFLFREEGYDLNLLESHKNLLLKTLLKRNWKITHE